MIEPTNEYAEAFRRAERGYWAALGHDVPEDGPTVAEHGRAAYRAGLAAAFELVERHLRDREHIVDLNAAEVARLREWLARPNGSHGRGRVHFNAVEGGGVMVRTHPYRYRGTS